MMKRLLIGLGLAGQLLTLAPSSVAADTNAPNRFDFTVVCAGVPFHIVSPNVAADAAHHVDSTRVLVLRGFELYDLATGELLLVEEKKFVEKRPGMLTECEEIDTARGVRAVVQVLMTPARP